jgi:hypothetical protein
VVARGVVMRWFNVGRLAGSVVAYQTVIQRSRFRIWRLFSMRLTIMCRWVARLGWCLPSAFFWGRRREKNTKRDKHLRKIILLSAPNASELSAQNGWTDAIRSLSFACEFSRLPSFSAVGKLAPNPSTPPLHQMTDHLSKHVL